MSRARWAALARLVATVVVLLVVVRLVGGDAVRAGAAVLTPVPVLAALVLGALWRALTTTRWLVLARATGAPLGWSAAYAEYYRSELLNQVVPGGVVGDVDRARRHGTDVGLLPAARAVVAERVVGQVVLVAAVALTVAARPELLRVSEGADRRTVLVLGAVVLLVTAVVLLVWQPWRRRSVPPGVTGPVGLPVAAVAVAVALSVGVLACFVALFVLAARVTGSTAGVDVLVPAVLVVLLVSGIPLTVAGWGAREAGAALVFAAVALPAADGVAASVGYGLLSLVSALPGLAPLLLPHRRTRTQVEVEAHVLPQPEHP